MFKKKIVPLLKIKVLHSIQGRIRIHSRALRHLEVVKDELVNCINDNDSINSIEFSSATGNMLITFDSKEVHEGQILELVENCIATFALIAFKNEREAANNLPVKERRLQEESVSTFAKRIGFTAAALIGFTVNGYSKRPYGSILYNVTSPPAVLSVLLSTSIFKSGIESIVKTKKPNADTLTMTAVLTAILSGRSMSALVTILLSDIAELMTAYTIDRTRKAIGNMLHTGDEDVFRIKEDGTLECVLISQIVPDDIVSIQTGDKIGVDGTITDGSAYIDQSAVTGEYFPVHRNIGDKVFAGTIIKSGQVHIKTEKVGDDTTVARIVHLVEDAASKKAQIQTFADKFSANLIPINFGLSLVVYAATRDINRALSMLIIDYSCGVRLSTATALSACIHNAASNGVLIKGGNYVETLANSESVILDKTGTMTEGKPRVLSIISTGIVSERELIEYAAAAEEDSSHPLAHSIISKVKTSGFNIPSHGMTDVVVGFGVSTTIDEGLIRVGNKRFMLKNNIDVSMLDNEISSLEKRGENVIFVALDDTFLGVLGVHDALKENMKKSLNRLRYLGFDDIRLLTGDVEFQAEKMAVRMNMDDFESELMPEDKAKTVLQMQSNGSSVMMIGDGINDAPALAYADVGVAIGNTRTDVAIESADITITNDDPLLIPSTVALSRKTMKIIRQNFISVIGINSIGIVLSAIGILPVFWSSVLHNSSTILVVFNSGRLLVHDFERRIQ